MSRLGRRWLWCAAITSCYAEAMTTMEIVYRYTVPPSDAVAVALAGICDVYGIRGIKFDRAAATICVGYDASRLKAPTVTKLVRQAGLEIAEIVPLIPSPPPATEPTAAPAQA
jgi:hypothetical protein